MKPLDCLSQQDIQDGLQKLRATLQAGRLPFVILIEDDDTDATLFRHALKQVGVSIEFMRFDDGSRPSISSATVTALRTATYFLCRS